MFDNSPGTTNPTNPSRRNMSLASASQGSSPEYLEELDRGESNPHAAKIATSNDSLVGGIPTLKNMSSSVGMMT